METNINKKMTKYFYLSTVIGYLLITISTINAGLAKTGWDKGFGPGFEIRNKTDKPILVDINRDGEWASHLNIEPNKAKTLDIGPKENLWLWINTKDKGQHRYLIETKEKTKYLTWNPDKYKTPDKYLYPQTGTYGGWTGKSESGYNLSKNVTQANLKYSKS